MKEDDALDALNLVDFAPSPSVPLDPGKPSRLEPMTPVEIALSIIEECELGMLSESACLSCAKRVMVQDSGKVVTLYCSALHRDLEVSITRCTSWELQDSSGSKH